MPLRVLEAMGFPSGQAPKACRHAGEVRRQYDEIGAGGNLQG